MAKTKAKPTKVRGESSGKVLSPKAAAMLDPALYGKIVDGVEKQFSLSTYDMENTYRLSTGMLCIDVVCGGGIVSGAMASVSGLEKAGKSTMSLHTFGSALKTKTPVNLYFDAENALNPIIAKNAIGINLKDTFYGNERKARLYMESGLELFYNSIRAVMKRLPDKMYNREAGKWFYVVDNDKPGKNIAGMFGLENPSKKLAQRDGRLWYEAADGTLQGFIVCDSYPSLIPELLDEKEEGGGGMAATARAFSENIRKVVGRLRRKNFVLLGVNQIRLNPGARFGNPEYEPGGEALKFYSSLRLQARPRVVPDQGWTLGRNSEGGVTKEYSQEPSIFKEGKTDRYAYVYIRNTKNKMGTPYLATWMRIQIRDYKGEGCGYCPVYDTLNYLKMTGRLNGKISKQFVLNVPEADSKFKGFSKKKWDYIDFKRFILAKTTGNRELNDYVEKKIGSVFDLRKMLFKEVSSGKAFDMLSSGGDKDEDEDMED